MKRAVSRSSRLITLIVLVLFACASLGWAATSRTQTAKSAGTATAKTAKRTQARKAQATTSAPVAASNGMRIFRDPETGEVGPPTPEALRQIALESQGRPTVDLANRPQTNLGEGRGWMLDTHDAEESLVMTIDKNGNRVMTCVSTKNGKPVKPAKGPVAPVREDR